MLCDQHTVLTEWDVLQLICGRQTKLVKQALKAENPNPKSQNAATKTDDKTGEIQETKAFKKYTEADGTTRQRNTRAKQKRWTGKEKREDGD